MALSDLVRAGLMAFALAGSLASPGLRAGPIDATSEAGEPQVMRPDVAAYRRGLRALERGGFDEAEAAFQESFRLNDAVVAPLLGLVDVATRRGDPGKAELNLLLAEEIAPTEPEVHLARARFYILQRRYEEARSALNRSAELAPDRPEPLVELGILLTRNMGRHTEAVALFDRAIALDNRSARAHLGRGSALLSLGEAASSREALETAASLKPDDPSIWDTLARLATVENDPRRALEFYDRSIAIDPKRASAHVGRGDLLAALGDLDAAMAAFEAGAEADPANRGAVLTRLGMVHEAAGQPDAAIAAYERAIAADDQQAAAMNNLAALLAARRQRLGEALAWARRAVEAHPEIPHFQDTLGWLLHISGDAKMALFHLDAAAAKLADHPEVQYHLGVARQAAGDAAGARAALAAALRQSDSFPGADDARARLKALE